MSMLTLRLIGPDTSLVMDRLRVGAGSVPGENGFIVFDSLRSGEQIIPRKSVFLFFDEAGMAAVVNGKATSLRFETGYGSDEIPVRSEGFKLMIYVDRVWKDASRVPLVCFLPRAVQLQMLEDYKRDMHKGAASPLQ